MQKVEKNNEKLTIRNEDDKKKLIIRINKIIGQMEGVKKMIESGRYCEDILIQLAAIEKSTKSVATIVFENHMHTCVVEGIKEGNLDKVDEIVELFRRF